MSSKKDSFQSALKGRFIKEFDYNTFGNITEIARGAFGTVYRANSTNLGKHVALKSLHEDDENDNLFYEKFVKELTNILTVHYHDNIINFYGISIDPSTDTYYLVLQYAKDGNLRAYLRNNFKSLDWKIKINMAKDITSGLRCIHEENIHSKNILVHEGRLLITDLGLSQSLDTNSISVDGGMTAYLDPEYLRNQMKFIRYKREKASDIYSLGVLFWELSSGRPPFNDLSRLEICKLVISGKREVPINGTPEDYIKIYSSAWNDNPSQRQTIKNIFDSLENIKLENIYNDSNDSNQEVYNNQSQASMEVFSRDSISIPSSSTASNWEEVTVSIENIILTKDHSKDHASNEANDQTLTDLINREISGIDNLNIYENSEII
ncbi:10608_t:CDS:2 [Diversispora eburnea]|uniref:10608_t:CDS:1 n=1 Tax=Diversispora eburnea TaxID=1213867 RepID=A0A9N9B471_9GLOM|nr:10608_t:CDS:2 [Diversispora eburnea]